MTTTITPQSGSAPLYTQQGVGTTPGYSALDTRRASLGALQEGVYGTATAITAGGVAGVAAADFMVTQRGAGANMSVDINMPAGGFAYVQGDTIGGQGLYVVPVHSATINEPLAPADPTNPRVDQVILEVLDNVLDGSGNNLARVRVLTGNPTSGATLGNRLGAAALPGSALLLGDVLVAANATSVANSAIRDRRKWARGANFSQRGNAGGDYTTTSSSLVSLAGGGYDIRLELSGAPLDVFLDGNMSNNTAGETIYVPILVAGSEVVRQSGVTAAANQRLPFRVTTTVTSPTPGSTIVSIEYATSGGTASIGNTALGGVFTMGAREVVRSNRVNNPVTSG